MFILRKIKRLCGRLPKHHRFIRLNLLFWLMIALFTIFSSMFSTAYAAGQNPHNLHNTTQAHVRPKTCPKNIPLADCASDKPIPAYCVSSTAPECLPGVNQDNINGTSVNINSSVTFVLNPASWIKSPITNPILFFTEPGQTSSSYPVYRFWAGGVAIVDILMVVLLLLNGIRIMLGGSVFRHVEVIETLPRILLALVVAHISLLFIALLIAMNNSLVGGIYNWVTSINPAKQGDTVTAIQQALFKQVFQDPLHADVTPNILNVIGNSRDLFNYMFQLAIGIMSIGLMIQVIMRILFINFYIVLSAPCIACWALPDQTGQPATRFWLSGFFSTVIVQFLQILALLVAQLILSMVIARTMPDLDKITSALHNNSDVISVFQQNFPVNWRMYQCFEVAILFFILRIPALVGSAPMRMILGGGETFSQAAGTSISTSIGTSAALMQAGVSLAGSAAGMMGGGGGGE